MTVDSDSPMPPEGRAWPWGLALTLVFAALAAVVAYYGIQDSAATVAAPQTSADKDSSPISRIELPSVDMAIPPGPHQEEFRVACTTCHSARLVFTQPRLPEKKWGDVVHKMIAAYGAPLSADAEKRIVQYLVSVHGK